jgi:hypothetical protein
MTIILNALAGASGTGRQGPGKQAAHVPGRALKQAGRAEPNP